MWLFNVWIISSIAQSPDISWQIILESNNQYNDLYSKSQINKGNLMGIDEFSSVSKLYPILKLMNNWGEVSNTLQIEGNVTNYNLSKDSTYFSFQELYTQFSLKDRHHWSIGKKRLNWGSGMIWTPTNFYIQKDPFRIQNRLEGILLLSYTYLFNTGSLEFYIFPEKKMKDFSYAVKYNYSGNRTDMSLSFLQYTKYQQFGYDISYGGDLFIAYSEGTLRNYSKSYKVDRNGKLIHQNNNKKRLYSEMVFGASMVLNARLSARFEYRFREDYLNKENINYFKMYLPENTILYDPLSISKHSLSASADFKDIYDKWNIQLRSFYDPLSNQLIISPLLA